MNTTQIQMSWIMMKKKNTPIRKMYLDKTMSGWNERIFRRSDNSMIVNYEFLIKNKKHLVDRTFLKYMVNYNDDKYGW